MALLTLPDLLVPQKGGDQTLKTPSRLISGLGLKR